MIAHAVHEELIKHKHDAWEWGVLAIEQHHAADEDRPRDRSGASLLKDKTGLGLAWGRAPKDGRGPKALRGVWRDWQEAEEFRTRFEVLTAEEVERRETERERASRCVVDLVYRCGEADAAVRHVGDYGVRRPSFSHRRVRGDGGNADTIASLQVVLLDSSCESHWGGVSLCTGIPGDLAIVVRRAVAIHLSLLLEHKDRRLCSGAY